MRRSRVVSAGALAAGIALLATACSGGGGGTSNTSDAVTVITDKPWNAYNNATGDTTNSYNSFANIAALESPFYLDDKNNVVLNRDLMTSVDVTNQNPQTVVWKINPQAVWSDGQPVSCKDFYLDWLALNGTAKDFNGASTTGYDQMQAPTCSDNDKTVTTVFTTPFVDYQSLFDIGSGEMMPAHVLEQNTGIADITKLSPTGDPTQLKAAADFWNKKWQGFDPKLDLADGPYMITGYQQNQSVTLSRNPKWWGKVGGPSTITLKAASSLSTQADALQNHEAEVQFSAQPDVDGSTKLQGMKSQGVTYQAKAGLSYEHFDLNMRNPLFQDIAVRQAFFNCVNRNEIVQKLIKPIEPDATPAPSILFYPGEPNRPDNYSDKSSGNPQQAAQILQNDGWTKGPDGIFTKNGQRLSFSISHTDIPRRAQTVQLVNQECKAAGIDVQDHTDPNFLNGPVSAGQYDVALFAWSTPPFKSSSAATYTTDGGQNYQKLSSPDADAAFKQALQQTSLSAAQPFYMQADKAIAATYETLPLFNTPDQWAYTGAWNGVTYQSLQGALWDANQWTKGSGS